MNTGSLIYWTFLTGVLSALATGLGAIPVALVDMASKRVRDFFSAVAAGMMIAASVFSLAQEGIALKTVRASAPFEVIGGLLLGALFFNLSEQWLERVERYAEKEPETDEEGNEETAETRSTRKTILLVWAMFIHSIPEGVAIGVGFASGDFRFGLIMALAISVHNIPEGVAISLPLRSEGASFWKCFGLSVFSSVPQPTAAVPAALAVWFFQPLLPTGLGFAGGAMMYLVLTELIPDALEGGKTLMAWGVMAGLAGMLFMVTLLDMLSIG